MNRAYFVSDLIAPKSKSHPVQHHQRRDLCPLMELMTPISELGFAFGGQVFNQAPRWWPEQAAFPIPLGRFRPGDLLVQCMRLPTHDVEEGNKRQIKRANTNLERLVFQPFGTHIQWSSRTHMRVSPELREHIRAGFENRREMSFRQKGWDARYSELNALEGQGWRRYKGPRRTALFLVRVEEAWKGGPGYLNAFGMSGIGTAIWAHRLAGDFKHLLAKPGFVLAELELGDIPANANDLGYCESWPIELLIVRQQEPSKRAAPPSAQLLAG